MDVINGIGVKKSALLGVGAFVLLASMISTERAFPQEEIQRGGILIAAIDLEPAGLDPLFGDAPDRDRNVYGLFYENLILLDGAEIVPRLAESVEIADDKLSIIFRLRQGIKFHDGTPLNAEIVKANLDRAVGVPSPKASTVEAIESVEVVDDSTVRVNLSTQSGTVLAGLATEAGMMISSRALEEFGEDLKRVAVGTGPFRLIEWKGDQIVATRNEEYWDIANDGEMLPYLDGVTIRIVRDSAVKLVEILSGNVQLTDPIQVKDYGRIESEDEIELSFAPTSLHQLLSFNTTRPPFDDKRVRFSVLHGIDRQAIARVVTGEFGEVYPTFVPPSWWIYDESLKAHKYDPDLARQLYEQSGHSGKIVLSMIQREPDTQISQLIQAQLREIGIDIDLEVLDRQIFVQKLGQGGRGERDFDMTISRAGFPRVDPDHYFSRKFGGPNAPGNSGGITDQRLFSLVSQARAEIDPSTRRTLYVEAQKILLEEGYLGFLFNRPNRGVLATALHGVKYESYGPWILTEAWLEQ